MGERIQGNNREQGSDMPACLTEAQRQSLQGINDWLERDKRHDGTSTWWRFFDAGVRDEQGGVWSLYNDFHRPHGPEGWRAFYCLPGEEQFHHLDLTRIVQTDIPGAGIHTAQLYVGGEGSREVGMVPSDILNVQFHDDRLPTLRFWSHGSAMEPVPVPSLAEGTVDQTKIRTLQSQLVGGRALGEAAQPVAA